MGGTCGVTEELAQEKYKNFDVYSQGVEGDSKPYVHKFSESKEEHMFKCLVDTDTDKVIGIHMVGKDSAEIIQGFGVAMTCGCTKQNMMDTICVHPTAAEQINGMLGIDYNKPVRQYRDGKLSAL